MAGEALPQEVQGVVSAEAESQPLPVWEELAEAEPFWTGPMALGPLPVSLEAVMAGPLSVLPAAEVLPQFEPGGFRWQRPWEPLSSLAPAARNSHSHR